LQEEGTNMKKQFKTDEELVSYLFDENFDFREAFPTSTDDLEGDVLDLFTKKYLDKINSTSRDGLSEKRYRYLMKMNTILFVGYLYKVKDRLSDDLLEEVNLFLDQNWKYLRDYRDIIGVLDYCNITIGGVTVYLCEKGPSRPFDSDITYNEYGHNRFAAIFSWYSSLFFENGIGKISGFRYFKETLLSPYCGRVKDVFDYINNNPYK